MSPFGNSFKKAVKEAIKNYKKIAKLYEKEKYEEAYNKALEGYQKFTTISYEEIKKDKEAMNILAYYLLLLSFASFRLNKYDECVEWGNKYLNVLKDAQMIFQGADEEKAKKLINNIREAWDVKLRMGVSYCILGDYNKAIETFTSTIGTSSKINVPERVYRELRSQRAVYIFIFKHNLGRLLTILFMMNLLPQEDREEIMTGVINANSRAIIPAFKVMRDSEKAAKVLEKYKELGFSEETYEVDRGAVGFFVKELARLLK